MEITSISGEIFLSCMGLIIILVSVFSNKEKPTCEDKAVKLYFFNICVINFWWVGV